MSSGDQLYVWVKPSINSDPATHASAVHVTPSSSPGAILRTSIQFCRVFPSNVLCVGRDKTRLGSAVLRRQHDHLGRSLLPGSGMIMKVSWSDAQWAEWLWNRREEDWAICSFACTAHSFACSAVCTARAFRCAHVFAPSLTPELMGKRFLPMEVMRQFHTVSTNCAMRTCLISCSFLLLNSSSIIWRGTRRKWMLYLFEMCSCKISAWKRTPED